MSDLPTKVCPNCRKRTRFDAKECPKCGHKFSTIFSMQDIEIASEEKAGMPLGVWIAISVIVMLLMGLIVVWHQSRIAAIPKAVPAPIKMASQPPPAMGQTQTASQLEGLLRANMTPTTVTDAIGKPAVKQKAGELSSHDEVWLYHCKGGDLKLHIDGIKGLDNWQTQ